MPRLALYLFAVLAITHLSLEYLAHPTLFFITKPLLLISLAFIFYRSVASLKLRFDRYILAGLLFSCGGDSLLLFSESPSGSLFFILGLGSFLVAHLCYIAAFIVYAPKGIKINTAAALLFYGIALGLVVYLWSGLDSLMRIAVSCYALTISTMGIFAYGMYRKTDYAAASLLLFGAICFIFSDSMIALNKFGTSITVWEPRLVIMSSYILAQLLIVQGAIQASRQLLLNAAGISTTPD